MPKSRTEAEEQFLSKRERESPIRLSESLSEEEIARQWTLDRVDQEFLARKRKRFRLHRAIQLCSARAFGRFLSDASSLSPAITNYLNLQLALTPSLEIDVPVRRQTRWSHQTEILEHLGYRIFDDRAQEELASWLATQARHGALPDTLYPRAEQRLRDQNYLLPGPSVLERLIVSVCTGAHAEIFERVYRRLTPELQESMEQFLQVPEGEQRSFFYTLKAYPPSATVTSLREHLERYEMLAETALDELDELGLETTFRDYLFQMARRYHAKDLKRFQEQKRYTMMLCFLLESRRTLLDHLVKMHDQFFLELSRQVRHQHEESHRALRKRQKRAVDTLLKTVQRLVDWPAGEAIPHSAVFGGSERGRLEESIADLKEFQYLEERGYADLLLARYPTVRKYFSRFVQLPFAAEHGNEPLLKAIEIIRHLDCGALSRLPEKAPTQFVPADLRRSLRDPEGRLQRNAWEIGLALAMKDALRSGDLYLPQSKQYVSFWDLLVSESRWEKSRDDSFKELGHPQPESIREKLVSEFLNDAQTAAERFEGDSFAEIRNGALRLHRDDKTRPKEGRLQKVINGSLPFIRIEQLLMEVDEATGFSQDFVPVQGHQSRPDHFYKTLLAAIISQATNLGVVSMSASTPGVSVDMLRHVLQYFVREETLKAANATIVDAHHELPLSAVHGSGRFSSSDAQRFKIRADSLLGSYYPRYFGYYDKAISLYTHVSDQFSVFDTRVISCGPREALYVLDGLLNNNTILKLSAHTTDTDGFTEIVFALCYLLGYDFMPRIKNLKGQQLYRPNREVGTGVFSPVLKKSVDLDLIEEQWDPMVRIAWSLRNRTAPAHVVVERLTSSAPSDRLRKAVTELGRLTKTRYLLRYFTNRNLRRQVQRQLNKGEYRQKLSRRVFFADQGEFTTGDYIEIMNKASCLSLVSNSILYWNTVKIGATVERLREQGAMVDDDELSHVSLLPFRHVLPNGTYFLDQRSSIGTQPGNQEP